MRNWVRGIAWTTIGLALGLALGLYLGWVAWPTEFVNADPSIMHDDYRRDYALMVANAYMLDGDLDAARRRLQSLGEEQLERWLISFTVDAILSGRDEETIIRPLVKLSHDLGYDSPAMAPYLEVSTDTEADVSE